MRRDYRTEIKIRTSSQFGEAAVIGKGKNAYLWLGDKGGHPIGAITGQATLRKIAEAILQAQAPK